MLTRRPWQEELAIIDRTMKAISGVSDPEKLVETYWANIHDLLSVDDYVSISRRNIDPPDYLITRSSRLAEDINPWTERHRLPRLRGGLLGDIAYAEKPVIIDDLPAVLRPEDPAHFYLAGFQSLVAYPQYDAGQALNVTCMLLPPGHSIDHDVIPTIHWQSGLFGRGTQNLVLRNSLADALASLDKELQTVGAIQRSLLPATLPNISGFALAASYETSARAGGDYYDFFPLADGRWGIFIADVSGHGTPAAVLMAITHAIAHAKPNAHTPPAALLTFLNRQLCRAYTQNGTFVTAFYAVLDPKSRALEYSVAGHNPPRLVRDGRVVSLSANIALPLGVEDSETYGESSIKLKSGDLLLLYTDGITEAMPSAAQPQSSSTTPHVAAPPRDLFGVERLDKVLLDFPSASPEDCINRIRSAVSDFTHNSPPADDATLIAIRCG